VHCGIQNVTTRSIGLEFVVCMRMHEPCASSPKSAGHAIGIRDAPAVFGRRMPHAPFLEGEVGETGTEESAFRRAQRRRYDSENKDGRDGREDGAER
jgi:hypothetical protein